MDYIDDGPVKIYLGEGYDHDLVVYLPIEIRIL